MTLIEVRICPCPVQFPLFDEICFTSWTAKKRLQVPILKEPHSVQLLLRDLYEVSKLEQRPWAFQFSSWSHFLKVFVQFFFFCTYRWSARRIRSNHHVSAEETSDTSGLYYLLAVIRKFGPKCNVFEERGFRKQATICLSYYNWMLILIPFYPDMLVLPCTFDLLSSPTDSDMTSWICIIPLN